MPRGSGGMPRYNCSLADTTMSLLMRTAGSPTENCGVKVFNKMLTLTLNLILTLNLTLNLTLTLK